MTYYLQFTARKRDPVTRERYCWRWGPYTELRAVEACARGARRRFRRRARVEIVGARGRRVRGLLGPRAGGGPDARRVVGKP